MNDRSVLPFSIPNWVSWLAQDSSGAWWGYSAEPLRNHSGWYENEVGDCVRLGVTDPEGWEHSLRRWSYNSEDYDTNLNN